jgi:adenylate cyclase
MKTEIERKFRIDVDQLRKVELDLPVGEFIQQGYLQLDPAIRVRVVGQGLSNRETAWLTIKNSGLEERMEFEYEIPVADAYALLKMCPHRLTKYRRKLTGYGNKNPWEVDEFLDAHKGLWIAELELDNVLQRFDLPTWAREDVTRDRRYQNANLAANPERFWETGGRGT